MFKLYGQAEQLKSELAHKKACFRAVGGLLLGLLSAP